MIISIPPPINLVSCLSPTPNPTGDILEFLETLPVTHTRSDMEINQTFQSIRDEWQFYCSHSLASTAFNQKIEHVYRF